MSLFFLLVSLEIRRETSAGALASPRLAATPALAAAGGAILPVVLYLALAWDDPEGVERADREQRGTNGQDALDER